MWNPAIALLLSVLACAAAEPTALAIRQTAERGIALLQESQKSWHKQFACISCHQQMLPALAYRDAREHGLRVDEPLARADAAAAYSSLSRLERAVEYNYQIDPIGDAARLIGAEAAGVQPSLSTAVLARHLSNRQQPEGYWATGDCRAPQAYSFISATAYGLRAAQLYAHRSRAAEMLARAARARQWLSKQKARSTEERAFQLFGLLWAGAPVKERREPAEDLAAQQRDDGGWNSLEGRDSDAYSTGEALVALHDAGGFRATDPVWQRGVRYLLNTQQPDGSWHVRTRMVTPVSVSPPYFETGYPYGHDQFISAMGAAWAIRALARALGPASSARLQPVSEADPATEPWVETVLFGSTNDIRKLLASGWSANSAGPGGVTALMMAMPDYEKARQLIGSGADVNARSKSRYSALLVAALYPDASPALELLFAHGARLDLPKGEGRPLYNATGITVATLSGSAKLIPIFAAHGEKTGERFVFLGMAEGQPALMPATMGDAATLRALLDAGLPADTTDDDGVSLLDWAVMCHRPATARLLIAHGADVNHVDRLGMTPLQHAALFDFGDSEMIDLLRGAGARVDARTKDGLTALDLARKYGHPNLLRSLGGM